MSGPVIWALHLVIGAMLVMFGIFIQEEDQTKYEKYYNGMGITLIVIGALVFAYHGHLSYLNYKK